MCFLGCGTCTCVCESRNPRAFKVPCYNETLCSPSQVFANLYHVMNDPAHWEEPREFRPDRFIDQLTGEFIQNERVIPFGVGRRACLGKLLAEQVRERSSTETSRKACPGLRDPASWQDHATNYRTSRII